VFFFHNLQFAIITAIAVAAVGKQQCISVSVCLFQEKSDFLLSVDANGHGDVGVNLGHCGRALLKRVLARC
jgi:hypothetical protein